MLEEVKTFGVRVVATKYNLAMTKTGNLDKRTKIGRALQPLIEKLIIPCIDHDTLDDTSEEDELANLCK